MHRFARLLVIALAAVGCRKGSESSSRASSAGEEMPSKQRDRSSASAADGDAAAGTRTDLSSKGLPITLVLPPCADGTPPKMTAPMVKIGDNAADQIIACEIPEKDALAGKPWFAIQVGLAKGKLEKKQVKEDLGFVRFVSDDPKSLEWVSKGFDKEKREFLLRISAGGTEFACFPQFGTSDEAIYKAELAACRSLAAK